MTEVELLQRFASELSKKDDVILILESAIIEAHMLISEHRSGKAKSVLFDTGLIKT